MASFVRLGAASLLLTLGPAGLAGAAGYPLDLVERQISAIPYESSSALSMGDGVEITDLSAPKGNCIDLANSTVNKDIVSGTVEIGASIDVVRTIDELERKLNRSLAVEASASGNYLTVASGSVASKFTSEYESFLREVNSSLIVSVRIFADHGRDWLDYRLKPEFRQLLAEGRYEEFRRLCGSHFVRAERRESYLEFNIGVSGLSRLEKETLSKNASVSLEGKGSFQKVFSAQAKGSLQDNLKSFLQRARTFGTTSITARLIGAPGIASLAPALNAASPQDSDSVDALFANLSAIAAEFRQSSGAPRERLLLAYAGLPPSDASYLKFYVLGELTRKYLIVSNARRRSDELRQHLPAMWNDYFAHESKVIDSEIDRLSGLYARCAEAGDCRLDLPADFAALSIEDVLYDGSLRANCGMDAAYVKDGKTYRAMSDIAVYWRGLMRFANNIVLPTVRAYHFNGSGEKVYSSPFEYGYDYSVDPNFLESSGPDKDGNRRTGPARAIFQIVNASLALERVLPGGEADTAYLRGVADAYADADFGLEFRFSNGWVVNQLVGQPDMRQCRVVSEG